MKFDLEDLKPCPNPACRSERVCVADHCNYVICTECHMTGPNGQCEEQAVDLWNSLPRQGEVEVTIHPKCDRCGYEILPGGIHYCMPDIEWRHEVRE